MTSAQEKLNAIRLRNLDRSERRRQKQEDREKKLAYAAGLTWFQWKQRQLAEDRREDDVEAVKAAIEIAKRNPDLRAAILRELGVEPASGSKALPAPQKKIRGL